jgi:hypothetical protein
LSSVSTGVRTLKLMTFNGIAWANAKLAGIVIRISSSRRMRRRRARDANTPGHRRDRNMGNPGGPFRRAPWSAKPWRSETRRKSQMSGTTRAFRGQTRASGHNFRDAIAARRRIDAPSQETTPC